MLWCLGHRLLHQGKVFCELQWDFDQVLEAFPMCNINMSQDK